MSAQTSFPDTIHSIQVEGVVLYPIPEHEGLYYISKDFHVYSNVKKGRFLKTTRNVYSKTGRYYSYPILHLKKTDGSNHAANLVRLYALTFLRDVPANLRHLRLDDLIATTGKRPQSISEQPRAQDVRWVSAKKYGNYISIQTTHVQTGKVEHFDCIADAIRICHADERQQEIGMLIRALHANEQLTHGDYMHRHLT